MKKIEDIDNVSLQKQRRRRRRISKNNVRGITYSKSVKPILFKWAHISPDLLRLVITKLNYEDRIHFRAVCKGWFLIQKSTNDWFHDLPLKAIATILMKLANNGFLNFFNLFIYWIKGQTHKTVKALLHQIPIQELYHWGYKVHRPNETMFTYFMTLSQHLANKDAEFYWAAKSIILRNHVYHDILEYSYKIIKQMSTKGHLLSFIFKNMLDIYFLPKKRINAVNELIRMINSPETRNSIDGMILALTTIGGEIYPETIFGPLIGAPICTSLHTDESKHYHPDGYPVRPEQMNDYACAQCKVALLLGCLSAYRTESLYYYLNIY